MNIALLKNLHEQVNRAVDSEADWETKYDFIFSDDIIGNIREEITLDYYDPDTSYEEDVMAFVSFFNKKMEQILKLGL